MCTGHTLSQSPRMLRSRRCPHSPLPAVCPDDSLSQPGFQFHQAAGSWLNTCCFPRACGPFCFGADLSILHESVPVLPPFHEVPEKSTDFRTQTQSWPSLCHYLRPWASHLIRLGTTENTSTVVNNTLAHPRKPSRTVQVRVNHDYCHVALLQQYQTRWTVITRLIITGVPKYLPPQDCEQPF